MDDYMVMANITNRAVPGRKAAEVRHRAESRQAAAIDLEPSVPVVKAKPWGGRTAGVLLASVAGVMLLGTLIGAASSPAKAADTPRIVAPTVAPIVHEVDRPVIATTKPAEYVYLDEVPLPYWLQESMQTYCKEYNVPYALALAIAETESSFDEDADSGWAYGLMQIGYINHDTLTAQGMDPTDREGNAKAGVYMIGDLLERYKDTTMALMCYNAGESGAADLKEDGYESTAYSRKVIARQHKWQAVIDAALIEA